MCFADDLLYNLRVDAHRRRRRAHPHSHILGGLPPYPHPRWLCRRTLPAASRALCTLGDSEKTILMRCEGMDPHRLSPQPQGPRATKITPRAPRAPGGIPDLYSAITVTSEGR